MTAIILAIMALQILQLLTVAWQIRDKNLERWEPAGVTGKQQ